LAYTVEDAIAAAVHAQLAENSSTFWYVLASVTITDTPPDQLLAPGHESLPHIDEEALEVVVAGEWPPITGQGPLYPDPFFSANADRLDNLRFGWNGEQKLTVRRGAEAPFYLGLAIEPVITLGPLSFRAPTFARPFVQRRHLLGRKHYRGLLGLEGQPQFTASLIEEDPAHPKLTGPITASPSVAGAIHLPATIEIVLESLGSVVIG
jgi:hypothetical protein